MEIISKVLNAKNYFRRAWRYLAIALVAYLVSCMYWLCFSSFQSAYNISIAQAEVSQWSTVRGTLRKAELTRTPRTEFDVQYVYEVDGFEYEGDEFALVRVQNGPGWDPHQIEDLWDQQHSQGFVTVYYDPQDASRSVLYAGKDVITLMILSGVFCTIMTLGLTFGFVYTWIKQRAAAANAKLG